MRSSTQIAKEIIALNDLFVAEPQEDKKEEIQKKIIELADQFKAELFKEAEPLIAEIQKNFPTNS